MIQNNCFLEITHVGSFSFFSLHYNIVVFLVRSEEVEPIIPSLRDSYFKLLDTCRIALKYDNMTRTEASVFRPDKVKLCAW
jgi:hypothetical protein